jgi:ABC-type transport system involved in cytochrome c biogenesis permease subunit
MVLNIWTKIERLENGEMLRNKVFGVRKKSRVMRKIEYRMRIMGFFIIKGVDLLPGSKR